MRTLRLPVAMLTALTATAIAAGAFGQPEPPPAPAPAPAESSTEDQPAEGAQPPTEAAPAEAAPAEAAPAEATEAAQPEPPPKPQRESNCSDGVDDDGDSTTDCSDTDCAQDDACRPPAAVAAPAVVETTSTKPVHADPQVDKGAAEPPPPETTFSLEGLLGITGRVGSVSSGYDASERAGMQYGAGAFFAPNRKFAFGLSYVFSGLGSEEFDPSVRDTAGKIGRRLHNLAVQLRTYPLRTDSLRLWTGLNAGLSWQTATSSGVADSGSVGVPSQTYRASAGPQAGLGLGASIGMDVDVDNDLGMLTSVNFTNHSLSSDALEGEEGEPDIPGIGSVSQLDFRLAFQYRFDASALTSPTSARVKTALK